MESFYNFSNLFSYNFERSDPKKNNAMKNYHKPAMLAVKIQQQNIVCTSPGSPIPSYEVIGTGEQNAPAGVRQHKGSFDWDDEWD